MSVSKILQELTNQIYDTIMENVGMSPAHIKFDPEKVKYPDCDFPNGIITLEMVDGKKYKITIEELPDNIVQATYVGNTTIRNSSYHQSSF